SEVKMKERKDIKEQYKWHLQDMIANEQEWEKGFASLLPDAKELAQFKGSLDNEDKLYEFLTRKSENTALLTKLYIWAKMMKDVDTRNSKFQAMSDRIEMEVVSVSSMFAFVMPELSKFSDEKLRGLISNSRFVDYSVFFEEVLRSKKLILSEKEEKILAEVGSFSDNSKLVFSMFDNADIRFSSVKDENGKMVELSHGVYSLLLQSGSQKVREEAFNSMFNAYKSHINTLAAVYAGNVKKDWFYAKLRGFSSSLDYVMYGENIKSTAYQKLLSAVDYGTKPLHKYIALRKKILGLETLNMYDLYLPIVEKQNLAMSYEKAFELVKSALKPLGSEYIGLLDSAFNDGWIDVFETRGKRSGAYSWGTYGVHPYVLLNYQKTTHDVFTIAHELGHAIHSHYSNLAQPFEKAEYEIFVAEIASTVNEVLLLKYLLQSAKGEMKKFLLSYYLDMFRTTLFRQTMFAEFEAVAHTMVEKNEPLTAEALSSKYLELNKKYYGKAVKHNDLIAYEWARIPHFYNSFYVYKYATGITAAVSIANRILKEGDIAVADYKKFLSAGGSLPPLDILRLAGVDMETDNPFEVAMKEFADTVDQLEESFK
ncbi:MAG: oligoendopeptidase F, partial [Clostridia bacterium]|nr:oligoendopeptidase F [Clostridia bacterium]